MMKTLLVIPLLMIATAAAAESTLIEIFADGPVQVPRVPNARVITYDMDLDAQAERHQPVFKGRSVEEAQAKAEVWRNSPAFNQYSRQMITIYAPLQRVTELRLTKIPAIVFDEKFVIYGSTDLGRAINDYLAFMQEKQ